MLEPLLHSTTTNPPGNMGPNLSSSPAPLNPSLFSKAQSVSPLHLPSSCNLESGAENPKSRVVRFGRSSDRGLEVQEANAWCHVLAGVTMQRPLHNERMAPVEALIVLNEVREM